MTIQHKIHGYSGEQYNARPDQQPGSPWRSGFANYTPGGHASFSGALDTIKQGGPGRTAPAGAVGLQSPAPSPAPASGAAPSTAAPGGMGSVINPTWQTYVQRRLSSLGPNATPADIQAIHDEASTKFSKHADAGMVATATPAMMNQSAEAARVASAAPAAARAPAAPSITAPALDAGAAPQQLRMLGDAANGLMRGDKGTVQTQGGGTITTNTVPTPLPDAGQVTGRTLKSPYGTGSVTFTAPGIKPAGDPNLRNLTAAIKERQAGGVYTPDNPIVAQVPNSPPQAAPAAVRQSTVAALDAKYPAVAAASRSTSPAMPSMDAINATLGAANAAKENVRGVAMKYNPAPQPTGTIQGLQINKPAFMQPPAPAAAPMSAPGQLAPAPSAATTAAPRISMATPIPSSQKAGDLAVANTIRRNMPVKVQPGLKLLSQNETQGRATPTAAPSVAVAGFRAEGGPVEAGKPYVVGEKGPEIIVPKQSGEVVPNSQPASFTQKAVDTIMPPVVGGIMRMGQGAAGLVDMAAQEQQHQASLAKDPPPEKPMSWSDIPGKVWQTLTEPRSVQEGKALANARLMARDGLPLTNAIQKEAHSDYEFAKKEGDAIESNLGGAGKVAMKATEMVPQLMMSGPARGLKIANGIYQAASEIGKSKNVKGAIPSSIASALVPGNGKVANAAQGFVEEGIDYLKNKLSPPTAAPRSVVMR